MSRIQTERPLALGLVLLLTLSPGRAHAYAPQAAAMIASRISDALPPAARWDPSWNAAVAAEVERALEAEDNDLERASQRHRFIAGSELADPLLDDESAGTAKVVGYSPHALAASVADLTRAFRGGEASLIVRRLAELAVSAADLADPFLVTSPEDRPQPAVQAVFSDLLDPTLADLAPTNRFVRSETIKAALAFAHETALLRPVVEQAVSNGDLEQWSRIRRERLGSALTVAQRMAVNAWREASSPSFADAAARPGEARIWPNPAQDAATISFSLPRSGVALLEVFDLAGRRVWISDLGRRRAGPQEVLLGSEAMNAMPPGLYLARVWAPPDVVSIGRLMRIQN